jgi:hypothetical protein
MRKAGLKNQKYNLKNKTMKYDFYYSAKQDSIISKMAGITRDNHIAFINDSRYTEMVEHGIKPISKFDDLVFVCTDDEKNIKILKRPFNVEQF